jgi:hypothetical protein
LDYEEHEEHEEQQIEFESATRTTPRLRPAARSPAETSGEGLDANSFFDPVQTDALPDSSSFLSFVFFVVQSLDRKTPKYCRTSAKLRP